MSGSVNDSYSEIIDLFPLPKGSPRKQKRRTANRKKTEILTDTPVKERIQQEVEKKNKKQKVLEMKKLSKTVAKQYKFPKRKLFREAVEYKSSSEDFVVDSDCCSDESLMLAMSRLKLKYLERLQLVISFSLESMGKEVGKQTMLRRC